MRTEELESRLVKKNINPTAMRLLVLDFLLKQISAISLNDLEKGMEPADRITLYRTLKVFEEKGLVHQIEDGTGAAKYALCKEQCEEGSHHDVHLHFFCNQCQATYCLSKTPIPEITLPVHFRSEEINVVVKGICDQCEIKTLQ
ncbi:Fur family transcriptional regulator [Pedobacter nutrimenti]|jgi:Fur family ferric uptake transcriptional regulator|uniref:Fur family ferric uptake transcriptional regulator n=1 Tax=Pedobacter nutrimenti TaxID=1241337 RepID=A0A318U7K6_9SPHI|nr:transcriptional repressor [Pedobacter nutrimenti]PYF69984.1 Fur family ferric uptake transcriptional regulator [Pedobacter nutrimenti]|eukprot:gene12653-14862_t